MRGLLIAAAAALALTPFKSTKDEDNNKTEYRSLLFRYTFKKTANEDGTEKKTFNAEFAGFPTRDDLNDLKTNVSKTVQEGVNSVKKAFGKDECCCKKEGCCCNEEDSECCCNEESEDQNCCCKQEENTCCCHSEETAEPSEETAEPSEEEKAE